MLNADLIRIVSRQGLLGDAALKLVTTEPSEEPAGPADPKGTRVVEVLRMPE